MGPKGGALGEQKQGRRALNEENRDRETRLYGDPTTSHYAPDPAPPSPVAHPAPVLNPTARGNNSMPFKRGGKGWF
jgi:hypothetical protein